MQILASRQKEPQTIFLTAKRCIPSLPPNMGAYASFNIFFIILMKKIKKTIDNVFFLWYYIEVVNKIVCVISSVGRAPDS